MQGESIKILKPSRFNILVTSKDKGFHYNTLTRNLIQLDQNYLSKFKLLEEGTKVEEIFNSDEISFLKERGFLIEENYDENKCFTALYRDHFKGNSLELILMPTLRCNFSCIYCFEDTKKSGFMTNSKQDRLIKFIRDYMGMYELRKLRVSWFGGEPLLAQRVIDNVTNKIKRSFEELKLDFENSYYASLVTNGSLLTDVVIEKLPEWNIKFVQITIDGDPEVHNERRPFKNGNPSFDIVFGNFLNLLECIKSEKLKNVGVSLRINFSLDVKDKVTHILDMIPNSLRDCISSVSFKHYFSPSSSWVKGGDEKRISDKALRDYCSIDEVESELSFTAFKKGYKSVKFEMTRAISTCGADTLHHFEIDPDLNIYKCNVSVGVLPPVGYIDEEGGAKFDMKELTRWLGLDPLEDEKCKECKLLPVCGGGCPFARVLGKRGCIVNPESLINRKIIHLEIQKFIQGRAK